MSEQAPSLGGKMDLRQGDLGLLESDLAGRLLVSTVPARFAFVWTDGTRIAVRPRGCTGGPAGMDPRRHGQVSFGALHGEWLVAALGLMPNGPQSAELAYWVRPEQRRRGIALRTILTLTTWAHTTAEPGSATTPGMTPGMTASSGSTPTVPEVGVGRGRADHRRR